MSKWLKKLSSVFVVCLLLPLGQAQAKRIDKHVIRQITFLTEGTVSDPGIQQVRGDFVTFVSDGDVMGPGTATLGQREVYLYDALDRSTTKITTTAGGESFAASRLTDDFQTSRTPIIAFISTGNLVPSVGNADGNPELFVWISEIGEFRQITNTVAPVVNSAPNPSDTGKCIIFESTGDITTNDGTLEPTPQTGFSNPDGSREIYYVNFTDLDFSEFQFTQVSDGPAGTNSTNGSVGGFFFPVQCEFISYQSDADQLGNGATGVNSYVFKRPKLKTIQVSLPGDTGGSSQDPKMAGVGLSKGGTSMVFSSNVDLIGNGSTGFQVFKYRVLHPVFTQYTGVTSGDSTRPSISDGGVKISLQTTAELIRLDRPARQGGPGPFNADGNSEVVRLEGKRRVRQITRTEACTNHAASIAGSGRDIAFPRHGR